MRGVGGEKPDGCGGYAPAPKGCDEGLRTPPVGFADSVHVAFGSDSVKQSDALFFSVPLRGSLNKPPSQREGEGGNSKATLCPPKQEAAHRGGDVEAPPKAVTEGGRPCGGRRAEEADRLLAVLDGLPRLLAALSGVHEDIWSGATIEEAIEAASDYLRARFADVDLAGELAAADDALHALLEQARQWSEGAFG